MQPKRPWYVITGAPCSGKTSVILELERRGYRVSHETARAYIDELLQQGISMAEIKSVPEPFEHEILQRKQAAEKNLPADQTVFLDRGIPDSIAYFIAAGLKSDLAVRASNACDYRGVFFLETLDTYHTDPQRKEKPEEVQRLHQLLLQSYRDLGYPLIHIPQDTIQHRADRVLKHVARIDKSAGNQQFP